MRYFIDKFISGKVIKDLSPILRDKSIPNFFIYDHTNSEKIVFLKLIIKQSINSNVKFISLPHAPNIFENKMIDITDLNPSKEINISSCNNTQIICHDSNQQKNILTPSTVIYHPRYTKMVNYSSKEIKLKKPNNSEN